MKRKGVIEGWVIINGMILGTLILAEDPTQEGMYISTSRVKPQYMHHPQRGDLVETRNSTYELGRPRNSVS